ncbi:hypothetical protein SCLCIDRAFT_1221739 [Scleroderma citrinum Foug A]|uniref:Uncharacterized protein n=1 Tax=Scleroderma citrinum Foug A TaxID=1036808 RepID=A0A0C2YYP5_9AGAM|nr:hypothetical protein SCLCIDRAFT_1221739 [Scleroderma citrinum Foug A]
MALESLIGVWHAHPRTPTLTETPFPNTARTTSFVDTLPQTVSRTAYRAKHISAQR